ncbi:peptidylprolyl isomerase [Leptolyngbya sp. AN02str]|uniref:peptidylprolyl isomerase n=1 Tax=Leptolyngbya sp. AN02str TaxID=3423363 RepID=UPI003D31F115
MESPCQRVAQPSLSIAQHARLLAHLNCNNLMFTMIHAFKRWFKTGVLTLLLSLMLVGWGASRPAVAAPVIAALPAGNAITDGRALLRYALPIQNDTVRQLQKVLEDTSTALRSRKRLSSINSNLTQADRILSSKQDQLLASIAGDRKAEAGFLIAQMQMGINAMRSAVDEQDKDSIWNKRAELLDLVGALEELMVETFPYEVPEEYQNLPQLKGRATVAVETNKGDLTMVVDGYSAPITAGNFVDLVKRGFYDGLAFTRQEDSYVLQIGDPPGDEVGFIDPKTKQYRAIPLEVLVKGDTVPTYGITLEDAGRFLEQPVLPFSSYGALAMARPGDDVNGGSSQFFFFLFEPELTPAGANLLDGRYSVFGYVIEGKEVLEKLRAGDKIISAKVISGEDKLVEPTA